MREAVVIMVFAAFFVSACTDEATIRFSPSNGGCVGLSRNTPENLALNIQSTTLPDGRVQCTITSVKPVKTK